MNSVRRTPRAGLLVCALVLVFSLLETWVPTGAAPAPRQAAAAVPPGGLVDSAKLFGFTEGTFAVNDDGAATYDVPLWVPRGRGGLQPNLTLSYSSKGRNGLPGMGWRLDGLSAIRPCPRTPAQDGYADGLHFDGGDAYCMDGMRLLPISEPQLPLRHYRTEQESFADITAYGMEDNLPDYFTVRNRNGKTLYFGQNPNAQFKAYPLEATSSLTQPDLDRASEEPVTLAWSLDRVEDRNGNVATVTYQSYLGYTSNTWGAWQWPDRINYGPNRSVRFDYELRPDFLDSFMNGVHLRTIHRLTNIEMYGGSEGGEQELLRVYRLSYRNDSSTGRSLLTAIEERDQDGVSKMPLSFLYSMGGYDFDHIDTNIVPDIHSRTVVGDVNGDGRDDLLYADAESDWKLRFSTGTGFGPEVDSGIGHISPTELGDLRTIDFDRDGRMDVMAEVQRQLPPPDSDRKDWVLYQWNGSRFLPYIEDVDDETADEDPDPVYFGDLDGNGMPDFISATYDDDTREGGPWYYRLNTGQPSTGRWADKVTSSLPRLTSIGAGMFDLDGDGRSELVGWNGEQGDAARTKAFGLNAAGGEEPVYGNVNVTGNAGSRLFGDINGDGLEDAVYPYAGLRAQLNSANGFGPKSTSPDDYENPDDLPKIIRLVDFNGDGAQDVLAFEWTLPDDPDDHTKGVHLWVWDPNLNTFERAPLHEMTGVAPTLSRNQPLDIDGDGVLDIVYFKGDEIHVLKRTNPKPDLLIRAGIEPGGQRVGFDYTTLADRAVHTPGECDGHPQICLATGGTVVAQHQVANPQLPNGWTEFDHTYQAARMDVRGRGELGFAAHRVIDRRTNSETLTEYDNVTIDQTQGATEVYPYARLPKRVATIVNDLLSPSHRRTITYEREVRRVSGGGYFVELRKKTETERERASGSTDWKPAYRIRSTDIDYDSFGNEVTVATGALFGRRTTVETTYEDDEHRRQRLPSTVVTTACMTGDDQCAERESTFDYDDNGNLTETVVEPDGDDTTYLRTDTTYGEAGTISRVTTTDASGEQRTERFGYDDDLLHPTTITNALGQTARVTTHSGLGVPLTTTDVNGVTTTMRYDKFGRLRETNYPDGDFERIDHLNFLGGMITTTEQADGSETTSVADPMGREIESRVRAFDGEWSKVATTYDTMGRVGAKTRPSTSGTSPYQTTFVYDNRDRPIRRTDPDGARIQYSYDELTTTITDAKGVTSSTIETLDGDIGVRREDDPSSTDPLETTYSYGPFGELTEVVAPDGTVQAMRHDDLGRRTRISDPSAGVTDTTYNGFGEATSVTDANGDTTRYQYDALGRVTKTTSPDGIETQTWDTAPNGVGMLAKAKSTDGVVTQHNYDEFGRAETSTWTIDGTPYQIDYGYDDIGRLASVTYPQIPRTQERFAVNYAHNPYGYVSQVVNSADGKALWTAEARNADGALTRETFGNQVTTSRTYDAPTGLPTDIVTGSPAGQLQQLHLEYDLNRNLDNRTEAVTSRVENYGYDQLNRLSSWEMTGEGTQTSTTFYRYDEVGNLTSESVEDQPERDVTYRYGENDAPKHALTSRNTDRYTYDDAGQQITGPRRSVQYNQLGLPTSVTWGDPQRRTEYQYDAGGARVRKHDEEQTVVYVPGLFERRTKAGTGGKEIHNLHNIAVDGRTVAQVNLVQASDGGPVVAVKPWYLHTDQQASTAVVTNAAGRPVGSADGFLGELFYDPFGRRVDVAGEPLGQQRHGGPRQGYTGHEHEDETGVINMSGRIYDPGTRRFLTPDPLVTQPLASQSLNRYSYVMNDPVNLTDPSGYQWQRESDDCSDCVGNETIIVTPVDVPVGPSPFDFGAWMRGWDEGSGDIRDIAYGAREFGSWFLKGMQERRRELDAADNGKPGADQTVATVGPVTITAQAFVFELPDLKKLKLAGAGVDWADGASTSGPSYSLGLELILGKVEATASTPGEVVQVALTAKGPSGGASAGCSGSGCTASASISAASLTAAGKSCTPVIRLCFSGSVGVTLGFGYEVKFGPNGLEAGGKYGIVESSAGASYEGIDENVVRAASAPGPAAWHAVRQLAGW